MQCANNYKANAICLVVCDQLPSIPQRLNLFLMALVLVEVPVVVEQGGFPAAVAGVGEDEPAFADPR